MKDDLEILLEEQLQNTEFKKEYSSIDGYFDMIQLVISEQNKLHLSTKEMAKRIGITEMNLLQFLESDDTITIEIVQKIAASLDMMLKITFMPNK